MKGHGEKKSRKRDEAIIALLQHSSIADAASACGINARTLWVWLQDTDFQRAYREARRRVYEQAIAKLQNSCTEAVDALVRNLKCGNAAVEVSAARAILDQSYRGLEASDLIERVETIAKQLEAIQSAGAVERKAA